MGNSKISKKVFGEFENLPRFPRKMGLYLLTRLGIIKPWTNIQSLRRFDLGFRQTSKQICRKLHNKEKVFEEFHGFTRFPRKMVLYSLNKFGILKPWTNRKPFFWKSKAKLKTFQKRSLYIGVSSVNQTFWAIQYWFKGL